MADIWFQAMLQAVARRADRRPSQALTTAGANPVLERVTLAEIQAVFAVTDALGISREALVIPLAPGRPGRVRRLPNGKLEIVLDNDAASRRVARRPAEAHLRRGGVIRWRRPHDSARR